MRILKYLFLLLLLSLVALSIFIATQKGDFTVERSKVINSPKSAVFNFVNDFKNWEDFGSWAVEDPEIKITYPQNTIGKGASYSWEGKSGSGEIKTIFVKENDSISQKMNSDGTMSDVFWSFKDTVGGTKVTWRTKGKMSFLFKIYSAFNGGVEKIIGGLYEKSLANLDKTLDYEINTYSVKVEGLVKKPETFYLHQTFTSKISSVIKNYKIVSPKIILFCEKNNLTITGKPFILYHTYDVVNGLAKISICVPIKDQIFTSEGSDLYSGKLEAFEAVKTVLTGDYSHRQKALDKTSQYLNANRLVPDATFSHLEMYSTSKTEIKNPSKWVTEIYHPIKPKVEAVKIYKPAVIKAEEVIKTEPVVKTDEAIKTEPVVKPKQVIKKPTPIKKEEEQSEF
ncbi:SRPBCC family protein [Flavobacterium gawalongense]|uniref:Transcriptional regulator n=1 Tax=Flavobacterium gawalongense TaxID=2594432 RepID=A0A553BFN2_9FLAO|nr:SRPBCC family protein [Flavobacterium gawalongense]TRX00253.1 transcriptional regulator [Flavobacterium gawalongense]TRX05370.1 transcriptional regulator [Flavobacterium gawalongense]TRX07038.1 transcriptional regulator [Flavobacterium gawalongense]TRX10300.1 transcriptional regulator [Flavobacterium gawalongense]TRX27691.1 transcriptional regulator [Flavobacterium gawalongense]